MPLTINCPKCRAPMRVDEKHLGMRGRCSKCGEVFTMTPPSNGPAPEQAQTARPGPAGVHNPFADPFGGHASEPVEVKAEHSTSPSGFFGFQYSAPPPPTPTAPTPTMPTPKDPPAPSPFGPFSRLPDPPPAPEPIPTWSPFETTVEMSTPSAPPAMEYASTFEPIPEAAESVDALPALPRFEPPAPVLLEVAAPAKAPLLDQKVALVEAFVVKLAARRTLRGAHGAIVREGKATTRLFVKVTGTTGDAAGWSETNPLLLLQGATVENASALVRRFLRPAVEGVVAADLHSLRRRLERASPIDSGPSALAKAAVEAACLDLLARTMEVPLHYLWGGAKVKSIPVAHPVDGDSTKTIGDRMKRAKDRGASAFHLLLSESNESKDRAALAAAAKAIPDGCTWSVGFLRGHPRDAALRLCSVAESVGVSAVRGVLALDTPTEIADLALRTRVGILAQAQRAADVLELLRHGVSGVVLQPTLLGWYETWIAAVIAQAGGRRVWLSMQHEGPLGLAAIGHLAAGLGIDAPILDAGRTYTDAAFLGDAPNNDEAFRVSEEVGVGVTVDEQLLRAAAVEAG